MSVEGYLGYWGSGKSLEMCAAIMRDIAHAPDKTLVLTNFGFEGPLAFHAKDIDDVIDFACCDFGTDPDTGRPIYQKVIAIDEIGMLLRARGYTTWPPAGDVVFQQGRKLRLKLYWTTQHWRFLDVNVRRVTSKVTECSGHFPKRLNRGERPAEYRPRLIRCRVFDGPNPESGELPKAADRAYWRRFDKRAAASYDTMKLVEGALALLRDQQEAMAANPLLGFVGSQLDALSASAGLSVDGSAEGRTESTVGLLARAFK